MVEVTIRRSAPVELGYFILSHLDLADDHASLHRRRLRRPAWVKDLLAAYASAPASTRLALQIAPLLAESDMSPPGLDEVPGLRAAYLAALAQEGPQHLRRFEARTTKEGRRIEVLQQEWLPRVQRLRRELFAPVDPPPLEVVGARELGRHGRGLLLPGDHRIAVDLGQPQAALRWRVLHEETHAVSDRRVPSGGERDTRSEGPGARRHRRLEAEALIVLHQVIAKIEPALLGSYERWARGDSA